MSAREKDRTQHIVDVLDQAFGELMTASPVAFRAKFRKMARDPHAFYRGTACLFYADVTPEPDPYANEQASRIWVHGDLHVENFGTYLNSHGRMVFDVNDFDEAYLGPFTWDLRRFTASLALVGWQKALPEEAVRRLIGRYVRAYLSQVDDYTLSEDDDDFALYLDNTDGPIHAALVVARQQRRADLLEANTRRDGGVRSFADDASVRRLSKKERRTIEKAYAGYLDTIPEDRRARALFYTLRDVVGKSGFGIGSAGLPAYNLLVEGYSEALDNDVILSMKQANVPAASRFVDTATVDAYFAHEGQRTVVSQRALQRHTDPMLGYTEVGGVGYVIAEVSPYEIDLDWSGLTEPDDIAKVVDQLGRATAKIHCASDEDSEQDLVDFQVEEAIVASLDGRRREFTTWLTDTGLAYAEQVRDDHARFVEAFRADRFAVSST